MGGQIKFVRGLSPFNACNKLFHLDPCSIIVRVKLTGDIVIFPTRHHLYFFLPITLLQERWRPCFSSGAVTHCSLEEKRAIGKIVSLNKLFSVRSFRDD